MRASQVWDCQTGAGGDRASSKVPFAEHRDFRQVRLAGRARHVNLVKMRLERSRFESGGRLRVELNERLWR